MREAALRIVDRLRDRSYAVGELADAIDKSQSWTSEVVSDLEDEHLVERDGGVRLANTYEATLLAGLLERYALEKVLTGTKEDILKGRLYLFPTSIARSRAVYRGTNFDRPYSCAPSGPENDR